MSHGGWLILAAALALALPFLIVTMIRKKLYTKTAYITLTASLCVSVALCACFGVSDLASAREKSAAENVTVKTVASLDGKDYMAMFGAFVIEENYAAAERTVADCAAANGWTEDCSLMTARLAFAKGDYTRALAIYRKTDAFASSEEATAAEKILAYQRRNAQSTSASSLSPMVSYGSGETPPSFMTPEDREALNLLNGGAQSLLFDKLLEIAKTESYLEAARLLETAEALWKRHENGEIDLMAEAQELLTQLADCPGAKQWNQASAWRVARMKTRLLSDDLEGFVADLDRFATCEEYTVAVELYINDKIDAASLKRAFGVVKFEGANAVAEQLVQVKAKADLSAEEAEALTDQISRLSDYKKNVLHYHLENALLESAKDVEQLSRQSKLYYSLSTFADKNEEIVDRNKYFSDALVTAPDSDDEAYAAAMNGLADIIAKTDNGDGIRNIASLSAAAVQNSAVVKGSESITRTEEYAESMKNIVQEYTVKASAAITVNGVNADAFPEVVATVQFSDEFFSASELKNLIRLYDCSLEIKSFRIEKVESDHANIILCCDNSGSMSGAVDSLKNAVNGFLDTVTDPEKERVGFYTFDNGFIQSLALGSSMEDLRAAVSAMNAYGGTNIYGSLQNILASAPVDTTANNVLILMTDGQDGYGDYNGSKMAAIKEYCAQKGFVVYVLGMGYGINQNALSDIAMQTGGQFIFSPTDEQLSSLYTFIHGQVKNKYLVTFTAADTLTATDRLLEISLKDQNISTTHTYDTALDSGSEEGGTPDGGTSFDKGLSVFGFETRVIVKSHETEHIDIKGTGFTSDMTMFVSIKGERDYNDLRATYIDANTFRITVNKNIPCGVYDVEIRVDGRVKALPEELTVTDGKADEFVFGDYIFTAQLIRKEYGSTFLSGYVTMNGWLHFNGSVRIYGSSGDNCIFLEDQKGGYVSFAAAQSTDAVTAYYKNNGIPFSIPRLGSIYLYADGTPTQQTWTALSIINFITFTDSYFSLHPTKFEIVTRAGTGAIPGLESVLALTGNGLPFSFLIEGSGSVSAQGLHFAGSARLSDASDVTLGAYILGNQAKVQSDLVNISFDTATERFDVSLAFDFNFFTIEGLKLEAGWSYGKWDKFSIMINRPYTHWFGPVPVTFSDFTVGAENFAAGGESTTFKGSLRIAACEIGEVIPILEPLFKDMSLLSIPEAEVTFYTDPLGVGLTASLTFLDWIELANANIQVGNYPYSEKLLQIENENVLGIYAERTSGIQCEANGQKVSCLGSVKVVINNRFAGLGASGKMDMNFKLWFLPPVVINNDADFLMGLYTDYSDKTNFIVRSSYVDAFGKRGGQSFYLGESGIGW